MENNERIEKLEKQVAFLTEELVYTNETVIKTLNDLKDLYSKTDEITKTSLERDMNQLKLIKLLSDRITNLIKQLES